MARRPSVRYFASRSAYYCCIAGKQHLLANGPDDYPHGETYKAAEAEFARLTRAGLSSPLVSELVPEYLRWYASQHEVSSATIRRETLVQFSEDFGGRCARTLTASEVEVWSTKTHKGRTWGATYRRMVLTGILSCLRWAVEDNRIPALPFERLNLPKPLARGLEFVLDEKREATVFAAAPRHMKDVLYLLSDTGCRPGEALAAEVGHYMPGLGALVIPAREPDGTAGHKTARTGKPRTIFLTERCREIVERLCRKYKAGPLFRPRISRKRLKFPGPGIGLHPDALQDLCARIRRKTGLRNVVPYSFRHTFAVRWLRAGKPAAALATIMGTSVQMIEDHYGHLGEQADYLRGLLEEGA